jgi:hypothetical protein
MTSANHEYLFAFFPSQFGVVIVIVVDAVMAGEREVSTVSPIPDCFDLSSQLQVLLSTRGRAVGVWVCYKPEGRGFDSR